MNLQSQQASLIEINELASITQSIHPAIIETQNSNNPANQKEQKSISLNRLMIKLDCTTKPDKYKNQLFCTEIENTKNDQSTTGTTELESNAYLQHKRFLQNYKKERSRQLKETKQYENQDYSLQEQEEQNQIQEQEYSEIEVGPQILIKAVQEKMKQIHQKIQFELLHQRYYQQRPKFKLFTQIIETKNDVQRISKQKRFIRSQQSKHFQYEEPEMAPLNRLPLQYRVKSQSFQDQVQLCKKAKDFVQRIHQEQQNLLGKHILRKKKEDSKRIREERQEVRKKQELEELKREQRKLKAEENLLLIQQKNRINLILNRKNSLEQLRRILIDKEKKLKEARESLENKDQDRYKENLNTTKKNKRVKTSLNEYAFSHEYNSKNKVKGHSTSTHKSINKLQGKGIRAKLAVKKHRLSMPNQQKADQIIEKENQFLDKQIEIPSSTVKSRTQHKNAQQISEYPKSQFSSQNEKERDPSQIPHSYHNYTEYNENQDYAFEVEVPKIVRK